MRCVHREPEIQQEMRITGEYPRLSRHEKLITIIALKAQQNKLLGSVDPLDEQVSIDRARRECRGDRFADSKD
jgi:hypothetical protein